MVTYEGGPPQHALPLQIPLQPLAYHPSPMAQQAQKVDGLVPLAVTYQTGQQVAVNLPPTSDQTPSPTPEDAKPAEKEERKKKGSPLKDFLSVAAAEGAVIL